MPNIVLSQDNLSNTSGWVEYYNRDSKISLKHPPLWKCSSWSKNNLFFDMHGSVLNNYLDENGRPVWAYLTVTIYEGSVKSLPIFSKLKHSDLSKYDSYEYLDKGRFYNTLTIYLNINGNKYAQFVLYRYLPENPNNIQTVKLVRSVINSFSID